MLRRDQLDKIIARKDRVIVRLLFPDVKTYKANAEEIRKLADGAGASGAVKME